MPKDEKIVINLGNGESFVITRVALRDLLRELADGQLAVIQRCEEITKAGQVDSADFWKAIDI